MKQGKATRTTSIDFFQIQKIDNAELVRFSKFVDSFNDDIGPYFYARNTPGGLELIYINQFRKEQKVLVGQYVIRTKHGYFVRTEEQFKNNYNIVKDGEKERV